MVDIDIEKLKSGDRRSLSKAITLIESSRPQDQLAAQDLLKKILPYTGKSFRLGVTGTPGVGKSTFIETFGQHVISKNHKIAVLAIDPSSPTSGGSILGDKTRMDKLANEVNAFVRPSPTSGTLGGVAQKTREAILLCEAAGFDFIIIETVGVGQSEFEVARMVDFFLLMILPNGGDELQGIKKGILELADSIVINKADGENLKIATQTQAQYQSALQITTHSSFWNTEVLLNSSLQTKSSEELYKLFMNFQNLAIQNQQWNKKRQAQNIDWYNSLIKDLIFNKIHVSKKLNKHFNEFVESINNSNITPIEAAHKIVEEIFSGLEK
ncbi:MAG: methylmalonyl Co-A mutase-associated GTPase MeaB [Rhizobacter sp.]|nr:methylmalonyl Co-A mutase-associated GTPase MeaB [Bacteriovorax sp.]